MYTYLVEFDCCVMDHPYYEKVQADSLDECWEKAYAISCRSGLSQGNFEIYKLMTEEDYEKEEGFYHEEDC